MKCLVINIILSLERCKKVQKLINLIQEMMVTTVGIIMWVLALHGSMVSVDMKKEELNFLALGVHTPIKFYFKRIADYYE